jgi:hypothetical protein
VRSSSLLESIHRAGLRHLIKSDEKKLPLIIESDLVNSVFIANYIPLPPFSLGFQGLKRPEKNQQRWKKSLVCRRRLTPTQTHRFSRLRRVRVLETSVGSSLTTRQTQRKVEEGRKEREDLWVNGSSAFCWLFKNHQKGSLRFIRAYLPPPLSIINEISPSTSERPCN